MYWCVSVDWWSKVQLGTVADWLSGIATVAAAVVATVAIRRDNATRSALEQERQKRERAEKLDKARGFYYDKPIWGGAQPADADGTEHFARARVMLHNETREVVHVLELWLWGFVKQEGTDWDERTDPIVEGYLEGDLMLRPGQSHEVDLRLLPALPREWGKRVVPAVSSEGIVCSINFNTSDGMWWLDESHNYRERQRNPGGLAARVVDPDGPKHPRKQS